MAPEETRITRRPWRLTASTWALRRAIFSSDRRPWCVRLEEPTLTTSVATSASVRRRASSRVRFGERRSPSSITRRPPAAQPSGQPPELFGAVGGGEHGANQRPPHPGLLEDGQAG